MKPSLKKTCAMGMFISLGVTLGFAMAHIPNVELMTATLFLSGYFLGAREGLLMGMITMAIYSLLNPWGLAIPPLFFSQIIGMGLTGLLGGLFRRIISDRSILWYHYLFFGLAGAFTTLLYDGLTNLGYVVTINFSWQKFIAGFITGSSFILIHILSNTAIFILVVPALLTHGRRHEWFSLQKGIS
jgi:energy-coupling factor transport system substrate-specific component